MVEGIFTQCTFKLQIVFCTVYHITCIFFVIINKINKVDSIVQIFVTDVLVPDILFGPIQEIIGSIGIYE